MHQSFGNVRNLDDKSLGFIEKGACTHGLAVYMVSVHAC
jgi:hypothetical protein